MEKIKTLYLVAATLVATFIAAEDLLYAQSPLEKPWGASIEQITDAKIDASIYAEMKKKNIMCQDIDGEGVAGEKQINPGVYQGTGGNHKSKGKTYYLYLEKGMKDYGGKIFTDGCKTSKILYEYHCSGYKIDMSGGMSSIVICSDDETCKNGACIPLYCSDDDGFNLMAKGTVQTYSNDGVLTGTFLDKCNSNTELSEWVCDNEKNASVKKVDCCDFMMQCDDGKCVFPIWQLDKNNNGMADVCETKVDKCPEIDGVQFEYFYDTNGDGIKDSCSPVPKDFCNDPDPQVTYPNGTLYSYDKKWHMGFCYLEANNKILHVICGDDKTWKLDVTECKYGMPCIKGACPVCYDTDIDSAYPDGKNPEKFGVVSIINPDGSKSDYVDHCHNNYYSIEEQYCDGIKHSQSFPSCPPNTYCKEEKDADGKTTNVACVPFVTQPICNDSDVNKAHPDGKNPDNFGILSGINPDGSKYADGYQYNYVDKCNTYYSIAEKYCDGVNPSNEILPCPPNTYCNEEKDTKNNTTNVACVPFVIQPSCSDSDVDSTHPDGKNPDKFGIVSVIYPDGSKEDRPDFCYNNHYDVVEHYCHGVDWSNSIEPCPPKTYCKAEKDADGKIIDVACVPSCDDNDPQDKPDIFGTVTEFIEGKNITHPDFCEGNKLRQYKCDPITGEKTEAGTVTCADICEGGVCK